MQGDQVKELFQTKVLWSLVISLYFFSFKNNLLTKNKNKNTKQNKQKKKNQTNKQKEKKNKTKNKNQPSDCRVSISARLLSIKWGTGAGYTPLTKN